MRTEQEMYNLILGFARDDERVRAVFLNGSRANPDVPKDKYRDYDIVYVVRGFESFKADHSWIDVFGERLILQMPEAMRYPGGGGHFNWMMLLKDGNRIDLTLIPIEKPELIGSSEHCAELPDSLSVALLDKDGILPQFPESNDGDYHIKQPSELDYYSCCNDFWWCQQNVAKGLARDELPYAVAMYHNIVLPELHNMLDWYIGANHDFSVSPGKMGKFYKKYLPERLYRQYCGMYSACVPEDIWRALSVAGDLFHETALAVAEKCSFTYRQGEENGIREYMTKIKNDEYEFNITGENQQ